MSSANEDRISAYFMMEGAIEAKESGDFEEAEERIKIALDFSDALSDTEIAEIWAHRSEIQAKWGASLVLLRIKRNEAKLHCELAEQYLLESLKYTPNHAGRLKGLQVIREMLKSLRTPAPSEPVAPSPARPVSPSKPMAQQLYQSDTKSHRGVIGTTLVVALIIASIAFLVIRLTTPIISIDEFSLPTANSDPSDIVVGPDNNLWFTESHGNKIGRIDTQGHITEFLVPTANSNPGAVTVGPDSYLWFTESDGNKIGRIDAQGHVTEFLVPTPSSRPVGIEAGPDGYLWFTEYDRSQIGRISIDGHIREFALQSGHKPHVITSGPDGALWFTVAIFDQNNVLSGSSIGRIDSTGHITEVGLPTATSEPCCVITTGHDGALWFAEYRTSSIGRITTDGQISEIRIPTPDSAPDGLTKGPGNTMWLVECAGNKIGRIGDHNQIDELSLPTPNACPSDITLGSDGKLWFTESYSNKIGRGTIT
jgi:virginiamycin B lyase